MSVGLITAFEILAGWFALACIVAVLWGVVLSGGFVAYWRRVAGWDVGPHGDLSEGR